MRNTLFTLALLAAGGIAVWLVMTAAPDRPATPEFEWVAAFTTDGGAEVLAAMPNEQVLLHTNRQRMALDIIDIADPSQAKRISRMQLPGSPVGVAISPDGRWALAALYLARPEAGQQAPHPRTPGGLAIIDLADPTAPQLTEIIGIGHQPSSIAVASSGAELVAIVAIVNAPLTVTADNIVAATAETAETADISQPGSVQVISINPARQSNYRVGALDLGATRLTEAGLVHPADAQPVFVALSADSSQAAAALPANQGIDVFEPYWLETRRLFSTPGQQPLAVAFSNDSSIVYSAAEISDAVSGYSLTAWTAEGEFVWGERDLQTVNQIAVKKFGTTDFAFALSQPGNQFRIYDVTMPASPQRVQTVQTTVPPLGVLLLPGRNLAVIADAGGMLNFYRHAGTAPAPPSPAPSADEPAEPLPQATEDPEK